MKRKLSSSRRRAANRLKAQITDRMSSLVAYNRKHTAEFKKLDQRLSRLQRATQYR